MNLLEAKEGQGQGTWVYRFGNLQTTRQGVQLEIPVGGNPKATAYQTTLTWELSATPSASGESIPKP